MTYGNRLKKITIMAGDLLFLYISLLITLMVRYGSWPDKTLWKLYGFPFLFIYFVWIAIFYIAGLYDIEKFSSAGYLRNQIFKAMAAGGVLAMLMFYLIPLFLITPKTSLFINLFVGFFLVMVWRKINLSLSMAGTKIKIFFLGKSKEADKFSDFLKSRPQLGYAIASDLLSANLIVAPEEIRQNQELAQILYNMILEGRNVASFEKFYESITGKIPVSMISEIWFLENLAETKKENYEKFKRVIDMISSFVFLAAFLVIYPFVAIAIKIDSKGPTLIKQKRMGKNGKIFNILKFRSMVALSPDGLAEKNGAEWAKEKDKRITFVGNFLRKSRIDELPQIWNVLKGDLSFIGPRPERPEFVGELNKKIPHYSMRHLVKPGLTGWAQINFPYGASVEDAMEKLQYDLYYIKNKTLLLDVLILLKTVAVVLRRAGR
ncbi:MAG: exopolysaccharide biosynthesis polyprenyl glycosylphosphotransferase [Candidatus Paceibacterota bacterium]